MIRIEIVYALAQRQTLMELTVPPGTTVRGALEASPIAALHPELDWTRNRVGIFGHVVSFDRMVEHGERIEIYRPLVADPKASRHARVAKRRADRGDERKMGA